MTTTVFTDPIAALTAAYQTPSKSFFRPIDRPVYHYTDKKGLVGILSRGEMWATDVLYMNDSAEIAYGRKIVNDALERRLTGPFGTQLKAIQSRLLPFRAFSVCVLCFSEVFDDLSQWRAYSHGGGFALGLPQSVAREFGTVSGCHLSPVCYDPIVQATEADKLVRELEDRLAVLPHEQWDDTVASKAAGTFDAAVLSFAINVKHPKFASEKEWRSNYLARPVELSFRTRRSLIVPYRPIRLDPNGTIVRELQVVVGPTAHRDLSVRVAAQLLARYQTGGDEWTTLQRTLLSSIPYRDW